MRSRQDSCSFADGAVDNGSLAISTIHVKRVCIGSQHLDVLALKLRRIDEDTAAIVVAAQRWWQATGTLELLGWGEPNGPGTLLAVVLKPFEGTAAARPREEGQLPTADHFQRRVANLKLAPVAPVVAAGAKAKVSTTGTHVLGDGAIPGAIEDPTVAQIGATGKDQQGAGSGPGLLEQVVLADRVHGICGGEELAE